MLKGKCVSSTSGFSSSEWPTLFQAVPVAGQKVFKNPTVVGNINTQTAPVSVTESLTSLTVSSVDHRQTVTFKAGQGYVWDPYIEVTLA